MIWKSSCNVFSGIYKIKKYIESINPIFLIFLELLYMSLFYFFPFIIISWRLITLQYCSGFCHTLTWISHGFTCIPHPDPPSHLPLYLIHVIFTQHIHAYPNTYIYVYLHTKTWRKCIDIFRSLSLRRLKKIYELPWQFSRWRICLQCRRPRFDSSVEKIPWRRNRSHSSIIGLPWWLRW